METLVSFLSAHGLTGVAFVALWGIIKYYVGRDIAETRAGIIAARKETEALKDYVEQCEDELNSKLAEYDRNFAMLKQEHTHLSTDIRTSISRIEENLQTHTDKEEIYQRDITNFMGYVYRRLGNGDAPELGRK